MHNDCCCKRGCTEAYMEGMATLKEMLWLGIKFINYSLVLDQFISRPSNSLTWPSGFLDLDLGNIKVILKSLRNTRRIFFIRMIKDKNKSHIQYKSFIHFSTWCTVFGTTVIYMYIEWWSTHSAFCIIGPISVKLHTYNWGAPCFITLSCWSSSQSNGKIELLSVSFFKLCGVYAR